MSDENALAKADLSSVRDLIAERIKASFIELMPEDVWKATVQKEIDSFIEPNAYSRDKKSPLQQIIETDIRERFAAQVKAELDKPEYRGYWDGTNPGETVQKIVKGLVPEIVKSMFEEFVQRTVDQVRSTLTQSSF